MRHLAHFLILIGITLATVAVWALPNRPVALAPPPGGKLLSVSFAPYRDGQSPLTQTYPSLDEIDQDLRTISTQVAGIRTYTSLEGMENVPALARKYGLTVIMGAWLGSRLGTNELEIASLITLANTYPDVIKRVVVGNEVLLRNELTPAQLASYLARVRRAIKQPVSTADVWELWLKHPEMAASVDYITIHLLPYWENDPVGVDDAAARILSAYHQIAAQFPGKPILVGEAGWPTDGRSRGPAVPSVVNKALFDNGFMRVAAEHGFDYNLIEAFDQSWKIRLEGTVGGKWGLYTADRQPKYAVAGPVVEDPAWPVKAGLSVLLALGLLAAALKRRPALPVAGFAVASLLAYALASALVHAADIGFSWHYYLHDRLLAAGVLGLQALLAGAVLVETVRLWRAPALLYDAAAPEPAEGATLAFWGGKALSALATLAGLWSLLLIVDGRYRDFPVAPYLISGIALVGLLLCRAGRRPAGCDLAAALSASHLLGTFAQTVTGPDSRRSLGATVRTVPAATALALLLPLGAVGIILSEGPINHEVIWWTEDGVARSFWDALITAINTFDIGKAGINHQADLWAILQLVLAIPYLATVAATVHGTEPLPPLRQL
jgi:exo-beta-1,3-glucanase (GH17 family)